MYLNGHWWARGGGGNLKDTVIVGRPFDVGTTLVVEARFVTGPYNVDLIAKRKSDPFLVPQGSTLCPSG
jgi:hypothetical protein